MFSRPPSLNDAFSSGGERCYLPRPQSPTNRPDHALTLPTPTLRPDRDFSGQRFVRHIAAQTPWLPWHVSGFEARNTSIDLATSGYANAMTIRAKKSAVFAESKHQNQLMFIFVLSGSATIETGSDHETKQLQSGTSVTLPRTLNFKFEATADDTQFLLVEVGRII